MATDVYINSNYFESYWHSASLLRRALYQAKERYHTPSSVGIGLDPASRLDCFSKSTPWRVRTRLIMMTARCDNHTKCITSGVACCWGGRILAMPTVHLFSPNVLS
eukprot:4576274-Amphidinium_carterae.1